MESRALSRAMVESVVDRSLREIVSDPDRSLRKLVDLGNLLARGRSQKESFSLLSRVLENEGSPYYDMVRRIVQEVDREKLKCFGINLGWESWTVGAGRIRALEGERHYNIPWCLTFRLGGQPWALGAEDYRALLLQGQELGICSYFFFAEEPGADPGFLPELALQFSRCAFFLFLPPAALKEPLLTAASRCGNLMLVLRTDADIWRAPDSRLRSDGCLHGLYRTYTCEEDAADITSGGWLNALGGDAGPAIFYVPARSCPPSVQEAVRRYALDARTAQSCSSFPVEYISDLLLVDHIISDEPCFLSVAPDGTVCGSRTGRETVLDASLRSSTLTEVLERFFPWVS